MGRYSAQERKAWEEARGTKNRRNRNRRDRAFVVPQDLKDDVAARAVKTARLEKQALVERKTYHGYNIIVSGKQDEVHHVDGVFDIMAKNTAPLERALAPLDVEFNALFKKQTRVATRLYKIEQQLATVIIDSERHLDLEERRQKAINHIRILDEELLSLCLERMCTVEYFTKPITTSSSSSSSSSFEDLVDDSLERSIRAKVYAKLDSQVFRTKIVEDRSITTTKTSDRKTNRKNATEDDQPKFIIHKTIDDKGTVRGSTGLFWNQCGMRVTESGHHVLAIY